MYAKITVAAEYREEYVTSANLRALKKAGWSLPPFGWTTPLELCKEFSNEQELIAFVLEGAESFRWFKQLGSPSSMSGVWVTGLKNEELGIWKNYAT